MEIKRKHCSFDFDDAESCNYESLKQRKKIKVAKDGVADDLIHKFRKNPCNVLELNEKSVCGNKKIEHDVVSPCFSGTRAARGEDILPLKIMFEVKEENVIKKREPEFGKKSDEMLLKQMKPIFFPIDVLAMNLVEPCLVFEALAVKDLEDLRRGIEVYLDWDRATSARVCYWEALLVVCDWEIGKARTKEALNRARLRGEQPSAELLAEERGVRLSSTGENVENILQGLRLSHGELQVLQSKIELERCSGSADVVKYCEPILKCIRVCKAKAWLKEFHAKILSKGLERGCRKVEEGTGSTCSLELLHGEEIADNFETKSMGVMDEADALSGNNDEAILQSQLNWWNKKCRPRKPKYFDHVHSDSEWNNYNKTHYDIIMAHYGYD